MNMSFYTKQVPKWTSGFTYSGLRAVVYLFDQLVSAPKSDLSPV